MNAPVVETNTVCSGFFGNLKEFFWSVAGRRLNISGSTIDVLGVPDPTYISVVSRAAVSAGEFQWTATDLTHTLKNLWQSWVNTCSIIKSATATFTSKFG
jgi:hypothetical protein